MNKPHNINVVLLSGGSGTRLWPLSNDARSKQFLKVLRDNQGKPQSMVQRTFDNIARLKGVASITIATGESQVSSIQQQLQGAFSTAIEPQRRNTAAAIMLACAHLAFVQEASLDETIIVLPIDAYADNDYYQRILDIDDAVAKDKERLVLLGVKPTIPSEKYGYIVPKSTSASPYPVASFIEKPHFKEAQKLVESGALWNCGVFGFKLSYLIDILHRYTDSSSYDSVLGHYLDLPDNSFDYEIVEREPSVSVVPYLGTWKDLGTWNTLSEEMNEAVAGSVVLDERNTSNVHAVNETGLPLVISGISDAVVVATPDGILVSSKEASPGIKELVSRAASSRPMYERRYWGEYRVLDSGAYPDGTRSLTKELVIKQGCQLSYQRHEHRSEAWTVVSGRGEVVLDGQVRAVSSRSVIDIPALQMHSVRAFEDLRIIEVQLGNQLVEEDIERFGYYWE